MKRMMSFYHLIGLLLLISTLSYSQTQWKSMNLASRLTGATILALDVHPTRPDTILIGTDQGLWVTTNGGIDLVKSNLSFGGTIVPSVGIRRICRALTNPNLVYLVADNSDDKTNNSGGVYKSTDGGIKWTRLNQFQRTPVYGLAVHPANPQIVLVSVKEKQKPKAGIFGSKNGGTSFAQKESYSGEHYITSLQFDLTNPNWAVAGSNRGQVLLSQDIGEKWQSVADSNVVGKGSIWNPEIYQDQIWLAPDRSQGVKRGTNHGQNWTASGLESLKITTINRESMTGTRLFCGTNPAQLYVSSDFGSTWQPDMTLDFSATAIRAIAWDSTQAKQIYLATAPAEIYYRTTILDQVVLAPIALTANGANPGAWQKTPEVRLNWQNPPDQSGIVRAFIKIGQAPQTKTDYDFVTTDTAFQILATRENSQTVFIWLEDGAGNIDLSQTASVILHYDATIPSVSKLISLDAHNAPNWFNPHRVQSVTIQLEYTEINPQTITLISSHSSTALTAPNPPGGNSQLVNFQLPIAGLADGRYPLTGIVTDSAGNSTLDTLSLFIDGTPPRVSANSPATTSKTNFTVSWDNGSDASGSGLANKYSVRVKVDNNPWTDWLTDSGNSSADFSGTQGQTFFFEAITVDNVGNAESFTGTSETQTLVDTTANDHQAPTKPINLLANGANPSPWQISSQFSNTWTNPSDPSGIARCYYKLGTPPVSATDTTATAAATPPLILQARQEFGEILYVWLKDGRGNVDHQNSASVALRYDVTPPVGTLAHSPGTSSTPAFTVSWDGASDNPGAGLAGKYDVQIKIDEGNWQPWLQEFAGSDSTYIGAHGHSYAFEAAAWDMLGNREIFTNQPETVTTIDTTANDQQAPTKPIGLLANSANPSPWQISSQFSITWTNPTDPSGIKRCYYKLGAAPSSATDTTATAAATPPLLVQAQKEFSEALYLWLMDGRGNVDPQNAASVILRYDTTAPTGTLARSPIASSTISFTVSWDGGNDEPGVGLADKYDVQIKIDEGNWQPWLQDFDGSNSTFTGQHGHKYAFEAAARDKLGNLEAFSGQIESETSVDTTLADVQAPLAPIELTASGSNPSPWMAQNNFIINWTNPKDASGIQRCFYKIGSAPTNNFDTTATLIPQPPFVVQATQEFGELLYLWLQDGRGNLDYQQVATVNLRFDATPPFGTRATSSDTSSTRMFTVSWDGGLDAPGAGLAERYDVRVKIDQGNWQPWLQNFSGKSSTYSGQHGHTYAFEAAAWDKVGNLEILIESAETSTYIDTTRLDTQAPLAPINLTAGNANPSPWQVYKTFSINWTNPTDPSGIARTFYKLGSAPISNYDTTATTRANPPLTIQATQEFSQMFYLWLQDGRKNLNYQSAASVELRYDTTSPAGTLAQAPDKSSSLTFTVSWDGSIDSPGAGLSGKYDVQFKKDQDNWQVWLQNFAGRSSVFTGEQGHLYAFEAAAWDFAGNRELFNNQSEAQTLVDTTLADTQAPLAPVNLTSGGTNPSPWQNKENFSVAWTNPTDPSTISRAFYKLGAAPTGNNDTTGTVLPKPPVTIRVRQEFGQNLYVWLKDGRGNIDFKNHALINLRYDATPPKGYYSTVPATNDGLAYTVTVLGMSDSIGSGIGNVFLDVFTTDDGVPTTRRSSMTGATTNGSHYYRYYVSDLVGNSGVIKSDLTVVTVLDSRGIKLTQPAASAQWEVGTTEPIQWTTSGTIANVQIALSRDGGVTRQILVATTPNTGGWNWQVTNPTSENCILWVTDAQDAKIAGRTENFFSIRPKHVTGLSRPTPQPSGTLQTAYRLVSVPLKLDYPALSTLLFDDLGNYDPTQWRLFDHRANNWVEYIDTMQIHPGKSYFLIVKEPGKTISAGSGDLLGTPDYRLKLVSGWNLIANPYNFQIPLNQIQLVSGNAAVLWSYDRGWLTVDKVTPWEGYAIFASSVDQLRITPDWSGMRKDNPENPTTIAWSIQMVAECGLVGDWVNSCGVATDARIEFDPYDWVEPPPFGDYVTLYFPHPEWNLSATRFSSDFQPPNTTGFTWDFAVETNISEQPVQLTFQNLAQIPAELLVRLIDLQSAEIFDLRNTSMIKGAVMEALTTVRYRIVVGNSAFLATQIIPPPTFQLFQNYPNPFNARTVIRYSLPRASRVDLSIFNVQGEKIAGLVEGKSQVAGTHIVNWEGRNDAGLAVASGVYFIRLVTEQNRATTKLIYLK